MNELSKDDLIKMLNQPSGDIETDHQEADALLLMYINDKDISKAFDNIKKWYA